MVLLACFWASPYAPSYAQGAPPCENRFGSPFVPNLCPEYVLETFPTAGELAAISSLAFTPDGALYFTSPSQRALYRLPPDGRGFFGAPQRVATLPEAPFGLAYAADEDAFYLSTMQSVFHLSADGSYRQLYNDPEALWHGELKISTEGRLYTTRHRREGAALISMARDGGNLRVEADGLHEAFSFTWQAGRLLIADSLPPPLPSALYAVHGGELVRLADLPPESTPRGMVAYDAEALSAWRGGVLLALGGSWNAPVISGYSVRLHHFTNEGGLHSVQQVIPNYYNFGEPEAALLRASFHPYRLMGIAVSAEGWLYTALAEGRIYRFRPRP
ncbi:MAG: hypothetical protein DYG88_13930 [Chloroflexi bacterium CFX4]|nr:hypothetical protein [Chloroflexi bacterium CFX4]